MQWLCSSKFPSFLGFHSLLPQAPNKLRHRPSQPSLFLSSPTNPPPLRNTFLCRQVFIRLITFFPSRVTEALCFCNLSLYVPHLRIARSSVFPSVLLPTDSQSITQNLTPTLRYDNFPSPPTTSHANTTPDLPINLSHHVCRGRSHRLLR